MSAERVIRYWLLHLTDEKSDKFYGVFLTEGAVVLSWGRRGTAGQTKWQTTFATYEESEDVALRQVYAKRSKGYQADVEDFAFMVSAETWERFRNREDTYNLALMARHARDSNLFGQEQTRVQNTFRQFTSRAADLVAEAQEQSFEELLPQFEQIKQSWSEIEAERGSAAAAMALLEQTMHTRLMGG